MSNERRWQMAGDRLASAGLSLSPSAPAHAALGVFLPREVELTCAAGREPLTVSGCQHAVRDVSAVCDV